MKDKGYQFYLDQSSNAIREAIREARKEERERLLEAMIRIIAENDDPGDLDVKSVAGNISTLTAAWTFIVDSRVIAKRIVKHRKESQK